MIDRATLFKRDYKRERKGQHREVIDTLIEAVLEVLASDQKLPARYQDHALSGDWHHCRECHIKPDLLLVYQKQDADILRLVRLGSHSEIF